MFLKNIAAGKKRKKFLQKAREGDLEYVTKYLSGRPQEVNVSNTIGLTALHLASRGGHTSLVSYLLSRGAEVNAATQKGNSAICFAAFEGHVSVVQLLVKHGASVNFSTKSEGFTPLYLACQNGHTEVVNLLLKNGANPDIFTKGGFKPFDVAVQERHGAVLACLLRHQGSKEKSEVQPVHVVAKEGDVKAAEILIDKEGFDVEEPSKNGFTPLHYATYFGNGDLVRFLISRGANVDAQSKTGITALHVACNQARNDILNFLLSNSADINLKTVDGLTPLHCASRSGNSKGVAILIERKSKVASKTLKGYTPLHEAIQEDHEDCAKVLLDHKASIEDVTEDGFTALHIASLLGRLKSATFLLSRPCNVHARTKNGLTALDIARKLGNTDMVNLLVQHGARIDNSSSFKYKRLPSYTRWIPPGRATTFTESQFLDAQVKASTLPFNLIPICSQPSKGSSETNILSKGSACLGPSPNHYLTQSAVAVNGFTADFQAPIHAISNLDGTLSDLPSTITMNSCSATTMDKSGKSLASLENVPNDVENHVTIDVSNSDQSCDQKICSVDHLQTNIELFSPNK